jgi:DNA-binding NarL/FixJ family response regulator
VITVTDNHADNSQNGLRIYVTGACDGLPEVLEALQEHGELELVGQSEDIQDAAAALAGGHLEAVLHATRGPGYPGEQIATIREYSRAPIILLASGDCSGLLEEALEDGVADLVPLPQLTENVVFAIRKACHQGGARGGRRRRGRVITVFSPGRRR